MRLPVLLLCLLVLAGVLVPLVVRAQSRRVTRARQKADQARRDQLPAYQTEKFELDAGPCVPKGYPARIMDGHFFNSHGGGFVVPNGHFLESDWSGSGISWVVGDPMQPVPDSLELRWFSYTDDKFYEGHFSLPQEKLYNLLKQGFWETSYQRQLTYSGFAVCVLPTGGVVVWLEGAGKNRVVVGRFQAQEIDYDYKRYNAVADRAAVIAETRAELPAAVQAEIKAGKLSTKKWDDYLQRYSWQLEFSQPLTLSHYSFSYWSEEKTTPLTPNMAAFVQQVLTPSPRPVPKYGRLYLAGAYGRQRLLRITSFDEHETISAFQTLAAQHPNQTITLYVEINEELTKAALSLRAGGQVLPLSKSVIEFFSLP